MKADVLELATLLSNAQASVPEVELHYNDGTTDIAKMAMFNVVTIIETTAGVAEYRLPASASRLLAVFYDDEMLSRASLRELEATYPAWRSQRGRPRAYTLEDMDDKVVRLYPTPDASGDALIPSHGSPFGLDYPPGHLAAIHSELREDFPEWLDLPMAFITLSREFGRDSNHKDITYAKACKDFGALLLDMAIGGAA